ncbi:acyltransferase family protein [Proteus mirabilis]|uniref:acyltransferase family protein n=1 Tax=Proteus mirabilis TaxID=584 RepID=UPI002553A185|nr:acyltransferase family protein [Proteus mirabilis]MDL2138371.1 acyltransferase family protein [Proteus mirabilis]
MNYRADIDGLRAVAVALVVLYHAGFNVPGGFIGVDIFFVISGFLITGIISRGLEKKTFSFSDFYNRRVKRIAPNLALVSLFTVALGYFILINSDFKLLVESSLSAQLSFSNIFFYFVTGDYFGMDSSSMPMLHTWSLGVEEQFYFILPIILYLSYKLKASLIKPISLLLIISFIISFYLVSYDKTQAYYMIWSRAFELLIGSITYFFSKRIKPINHEYIPIIGLFLITLSAFYLNSSSPFPSYNALIPCIGASMVILSKETLLIGKLLSIKPINYIGRLSYSIYLWHWPIIVLFVFYKPFGQVHTFLSLLVILLLSAFSYHFVEQKTRHLKTSLTKSVSIFVFIPTMLMSFSLYLSNNYNKNESEFDERYMADIYKKSCFNSYNMQYLDICNVGDESSNVSGLLIGDSHANSLSSFIDYLAKDAGLKFQEKTIQWVPPIPGVSFGESLNERKSEWTKKYNDEAKKYKYVVISSNWPEYERNTNKNNLFDDNGKIITSRYRNEVFSMIDDFINNGTHVFLIISNNSIDFSELKKAKLSGIDINSNKYKAKNNQDYFLYEKYKNNNDVTIININDILCNGDYCSSSIDGTILYRDNGHLNLLGSELIAKKYVSKYGNPMKDIK